MSTWKSNCKHVVTRRRGLVRYRYSSGYSTLESPKFYDEIELEGDVTLEINIAALMDLMGARALAAKSGRSSYMGGLVKAKVARRGPERLIKTTSNHIGDSVEILESRDD